MKQIAIYGGTFDPPHNGHIHLAIRIMKMKNLDQLIFIPAAKPPHKPDQPISDFDDRYNMLVLATEKFKNISISKIEYERLPNSSFTFDTMNSLALLCPNDELSIIIGADSLAMIHTWYKCKELVKRWNFITYPRAKVDIKIEILLKYWEKDLAVKLYNSLIDSPVYDISSTEIRQMIRNGDKKLSMIDENVYNYIINNKLYS